MLGFSLSQATGERQRMRGGKSGNGNVKRECEKTKGKSYSRSCSGLSEPHSEPAVLCSWMVCSSSDSEGRSLKVLSSRPGASREKRRTRWGRGTAPSGSSASAGASGSAGPSAPVASVTAGFSETWPLFWFTSASPRPVHKQTRGHLWPGRERRGRERGIDGRVMVVVLVVKQWHNGVF